MRIAEDQATATTRVRWSGLRTMLTASCLLPAAAVLTSGSAFATTFQTNIPDLTINWDNTITFTSLFQTESPNKTELADPNDDDTDRNIRNGLAAQRFDGVTELDIRYGNFGARGSAAAWDDLLYNFGNDNNSAATLNSFVADNRDYAKHAQQLAGYHAEVQDLFTYGDVPFENGGRFSYRIGQFTQIWGESLFLASNGIAAGQNPIDAIKAQLLLNPEARDIYMPTPNVSVTYEPNTDLSFSAYYKLGWRPTRISPAGTYFSSTDILDAGGDKLFLGPLPGDLGLAYVTRGNDERPNGLDGQFGVDARYKIGDYDLGLYFVRYDDDTPGQEIYYKANTGAAALQYLPSIGTYQVAYAHGIQIYGASFSTNIFTVINLAGEASVRTNQPVLTNFRFVNSYAGSVNNVEYVRGDTLNAQVSAIYASTPIHALRTNGLSILGEIGGNHLLAVSDYGGSTISSAVNRTALEGQIVANLSYLQALPKTDVTPSVGIAWDFYHTSPIDASDRAETGNLQAGIAFLYDQTYSIQLQYKHFFGAVSNTNDAVNNTLLGRDYAGVEIQRTF